MSYLIDSHCHLTYYKKENINQIIKDAIDNNILILENVCVDLTDIPQLREISQEHDNIYYSVGVHPCNVTNINQDDLYNQLTEFACNDNKINAIGETGLDYYHSIEKKELQKINFATQIEAARTLDLPVIIHARNTDEDMIKILEYEMQKKKFKAVLHSFASSEKLFRAALDMDIYISFSGILTFKSSEELRNIAKHISLDKVLIETDSPFLAPQLYRGQENRPSYIKNTADILEKLLGIDDIAKVTTDNFYKLFDKTAVL